MIKSVRFWRDTAQRFTYESVGENIKQFVIWADGHKTKVCFARPHAMFAMPRPYPKEPKWIPDKEWCRRHYGRAWAEGAVGAMDAFLAEDSKGNRMWRGPTPICPHCKEEAKTIGWTYAVCTDCSESGRIFAY